LAPACLVQLQMFNSYGLIDNDGIMVALGAVCLLALLRARRGLTTRRAVLFGTTVGLCALGKGTAVQLTPLLAIGLAALYILTGRRRGQFFRWMGVAGVTAVVFIVPWIVFNLHAYHALSGAKPQAALVEPFLGRLPLNLSGAHHLWTLALVSSFVAQLPIAPTLTSHYRAAWAVVGLATVSAGTLVAAAFRRWHDAAAELWLGISLPLGLAALIVATMSQGGAGASVVGRHLAALLPVLCLAIAFGSVSVFGRRLGTTVMLIFFVFASSAEIGGQQALVRLEYTQPTFGKAAPVIDQSYNDGTAATATAVSVRSRCPATDVALAFAAPPPHITIDNQNIAPSGTAGVWTTYFLPSPQSGPFTIAFPKPIRLYVDNASPSPELTVVATPLVRAAPVARVYCNVRDPLSFRFRELYSPQHPFPLTLRDLSDWPYVERTLTIVVTAIVMVALALEPLRRLRARAGMGKNAPPRPD
jgi:hypothetical protein